MNPNVLEAEFVTRRGTSFMLNGAPFRFVGANVYNAAGDPEIYECGPWMSDPETELDDWFMSLERDSGSRVIRFWAYQSYTNGGTDWRALDRVMRLANKRDLKVIPVLENQWSACTEGGYKYDRWYAGGYSKPYGGYALSYKEYVRRAVERYRNEPAIAAWMLMNEAESKAADDTSNPEALYAFARDMSAYVKSIDKNHLVTLGVIGGPQAGVHGPSYERLHDLATIDFLDFHDYGANDEAMPGAPLVPLTPLNTGIYTQDQNWTWNSQGYRRNKARVWEKWTGTVPEGAEPFQSIGIDLYEDFAGDVYIDRIQVGSRVYDFEDGTIEGWHSTDSVTLSNASNIAYAGSRSLKLTLSATGGRQVWIPASPEDVPGTPITVHTYVDTPGSRTDYSDTLARAMQVSRELDKPIVVSEAGMTIYESENASQVETPDSRAQKFDAKIDAFFDDGGAGYLIWAPGSDPGANRTYNFSPGDPLNTVLARYATAF